MDENRYNTLLELEETLVETQKLLKRVEAFHYANVIKQLIDTLQENERAAMSILMGNEFWGGSGSFADLQFYENYHTSADFDRDNKHYRTLLSKILALLRILGYSNYRSSFWEPAFEAYDKPRGFLRNYFGGLIFMIWYIFCVPIFYIRYLAMKIMRKM